MQVVCDRSWKHCRKSTALRNAVSPAGRAARKRDSGSAPLAPRLNFFDNISGHRTISHKRTSSAPAEKSRRRKRRSIPIPLAGAESKKKHRQRWLAPNCVPPPCKQPIGVRLIVGQTVKKSTPTATHRHRFDWIVTQNDPVSLPQPTGKSVDFLRRNFSRLLQICQHLVGQGFGGLRAGVQDQFGLERGFVRIVDAGEALDLAGPGLFV